MGSGSGGRGGGVSEDPDARRPTSSKGDCRISRERCGCGIESDGIVNIAVRSMRIKGLGGLRPAIVAVHPMLSVSAVCY